MSATTIGIVGAAVGGGAIAATQLTGKDEGPSGGRKILTGTFSGQYTLVFSSGASSCSRVHSVTGTLTVKLGNDPAKAEGTAEISGSNTVVSSQCSGGPQAGNRENLIMDSTPLEARTGGFAFEYQRANQFQDTPSSPQGTHTVFFKFDGGFERDNATAVGTLVHGEKVESPGTPTVAATTTYPITLR